MNLCLVGHGGIATEHVKAMRGLENVELSMVVGAESAAASKFASEWGFRRSTSRLDEALADPSIDLVVIASPNDQHSRQAEAAIAAGKNVLIEIPLALNLADASRLAHLATESRRTYMVAHTSRFFSRLAAMRRQVDEGMRPLHTMAALGVDKRTNRNWKGEARAWVDDILWHHACHAVDTVLWLNQFDPVERITAQGGRKHPEHMGLMDLAVTLRFSGGSLATVGVSYHAAEPFTSYTLVADSGVYTYRQGTSGPSDDGSDGDDLTELVERQDRAFIEACSNETPTPISIDDVMPTLRVLEEIQRQIDPAQLR